MQDDKDHSLYGFWKDGLSVYTVYASIYVFIFLIFLESCDLHHYVVLSARVFNNYILIGGKKNVDKEAKN